MIYTLVLDNAKILNQKDHQEIKNITYCNRKFLDKIIRRVFDNKIKLLGIYRQAPGMPPHWIEECQAYDWNENRLIVAEHAILWTIPLEEILEINTGE